jgi:thioredoxin 1
MSVLKITKSNFESEVLNSDKPVLLDFWAAWCGPCRMVGPIVEEVAEQVGATAKVGKINVDEEQELAQKFNVMSIPTLIVIKNGKVVQSAVGVQSKQTLLSMLQ